MSTSPVQTLFPFMPPPPPLPTEMNVYGKYVTEPGKSYITIRRGDKWANVPEGHFIDLTEQPGGSFGTKFRVGTGVVEAVKKIRFRDIPAVWLSILHTGEKTYSQVFDSMVRAYGDGFKDEEEVVVLQYKRLS